MLPRILGIALLLVLLAGCASPAPAAPPAASATAPAATLTPAPTQTAVPISYEKSLLLARWDIKTRHHVLLPVDPATGEPLPGYDPIDIQVNYSHAYSPDRRTLVVVSYLGDSPSDPLLHLIDLSTWRETTVELDVTGWAGNALSFSDDGSLLAMAFSYRENNLVLFDLRQGAVSAQVETDFNITRLKFMADGKALMAYGQVVVERFTENEHTEGPARVALFDIEGLGTRWSRELPGVLDGVYPSENGDGGSVHMPGNGFYVNPAAVFAQSDDVLYIVHGDAEKLTLVDFKGRTFRTLGFHPVLTWFERFLMIGARAAHAKVAAGKTRVAVLSPDGQLLYTVGMDNQFSQAANGEWELNAVPLNLQAVRTKDAAVVFEEEVFASSLAMAPDGSRLFMMSWKDNDFYGQPSTAVYDLNSRQMTRHYDGVYLMSAWRMDGTPVLASSAPVSNSGNDTHLGVYDFESGDPIGEWVDPFSANWLTAP